MSDAEYGDTVGATAPVRRAPLSAAGARTVVDVSPLRHDAAGSATAASATSPMDLSGIDPAVLEAAQTAMLAERNKRIRSKLEFWVGWLLSGVLIITSILWLGVWSGTRPASFKPLWGTLLALGLLLAVLTVYWGFRGRVLPRTCCACVPNYVESPRAVSSSDFGIVAAVFTLWTIGLLIAIHFGEARSHWGLYNNDDGSDPGAQSFGANVWGVLIGAVVVAVIFLFSLGCLITLLRIALLLLLKAASSSPAAQHADAPAQQV